MAPSLGDAVGAGLERSCGPDEWVAAAGPVDGVELFRARLRGRPFSRHRHDVYAIGVTEEGVQAFEYALVLALAEGLLRSGAAGSACTLRCRVDLPAVARGRDYLPCQRRSYSLGSRAPEISAIHSSDTIRSGTV
jgi:hypothetical protein